MSARIRTSSQCAFLFSGARLLPFIFFWSTDKMLALFLKPTKVRSTEDVMMCKKTRKKESPEPVPVVFFKGYEMSLLLNGCEPSFLTHKLFPKVHKVQTRGKFVQVLKMVG